MLIVVVLGALVVTVGTALTFLFCRWNRKRRGEIEKNMVRALRTMAWRNSWLTRYAPLPAYL